MSLILSIDTSLEEAAIGLAEDDRLLVSSTNSNQTDHAAWIHTAIRSLFKETDRSLGELSAVAVASGPGSYTGLRVGMATAKGLCFSLDVPLVTETTLKLTAWRVRNEISKSVFASPVWICPMIDARRMEVFTILYDMDLREMSAPGALVLNETSFGSELQQCTVVFCGNGVPKWKTICHHPNAVFNSFRQNIADLAAIASEKLRNGEFSELAYTEPDYFKNVYTGK